MKKIYLFSIFVAIVVLVSVLGVNSAGASGVCLDEYKNTTNLTEAECKSPNKALLGYTWKVDTAIIGVCMDPKNISTNLSKAACQEKFFLWYRWYDDINSVPRCDSPKVFEKGVCTEPVLGSGNPDTSADGTTTPPTNYTFLAPLPCNGTEAEGCIDGQFKTFDPTNATGENSNLGRYLNIMLRIFIGICAVLAVIMVVVGGIEYMTSDLMSSKEEGRHRISGAIFGLILALGSWMLLNQINPDLLKTDLSSLKNVEVEVTVNDSVPQTYDPVTKKYKSSGYTYGASWASTAGGSETSLPAWVTLNNPQCQTVGQANCTSTRRLPGNYLNTIHAGCSDCPLVLTGGTESWSHGGASGSTSHGPGSPTVDLRMNDKLTAYIKSGTKEKSPNRWTKDGISFLYENHNGIEHWHAGR